MVRSIRRAGTNCGESDGEIGKRTGLHGAKKALKSGRLGVKDAERIAGREKLCGAGIVGRVRVERSVAEGDELVERLVG